MKLFRVKQLEWVKDKRGPNYECYYPCPGIERFVIRAYEDEGGWGATLVVFRLPYGMSNLSTVGKETAQEAASEMQALAHLIVERELVDPENSVLEEVGIQLNQDNVVVIGAFDIATRRYLIQVRTEMMMGRCAISEEEFVIQRGTNPDELVEMNIQKVFEALSRDFTNNMVRIVPIDQVYDFDPSGHKVSGFFNQRNRVDENKGPLLLDDRGGMPTDLLHLEHREEVDRQGPDEEREA